MKLTSDQARAARAESGHYKVIAGAGSGKSTMMVARVRNLIAKGMPPSTMLICMFGSEAADSFAKRTKRAVGNMNVPIPHISTFHSTASKHVANILIQKGHLPQTKLITKDSQMNALMLDVLKNYCQNNSQLYGALYEFRTFVDLTKSHLDGPQFTFTKYEFPAEKSYFLDAFRRFEKLRQSRGMAFFSDMIYDPIKLLSDKPDLIPLVSNQFDHIMVDEFQDINDIQFFMLLTLAGTRAHVMVVGDDDQCIYGWRGANPYYMINGFNEAFENVQTIELRETFRYGHQIASSAYSLICNNKHRTPKLAVSGEGTPNTVLSLDKDMPGQRSINKHIRQWMLREDTKYSDVAVLVRAYSHSVSVEIGLLEDGIPYKLDGADPVFDAPDIGAVVAGLHLVNGTYGRMQPFEKAQVAMKFIGYPSLRLAYENMRTLQDKIFKDPDGTAIYLDECIYDQRDSNVKTVLRDRSNAWRNLMDAGGSKSVKDHIRDIISTLRIMQEIEFTSKTESEKETKKERFEAFVLYADHSKMDLHQFMDHIQSLMGKASSKEAKAQLEKRGAVSITSIHRSKGLEWPLVIIPKLIEGKFPLIKGDFLTPEAEEDERRLLYVAVTRAMKQCILIVPDDTRFDYCSKRGIDKPQEPLSAGEGTASRFLYELNPFLCQRADAILGGDVSILKVVKSPERMVEYLKKLGEVRGYSAKKEPEAASG